MDDSEKLQLTDVSKIDRLLVIDPRLLGNSFFIDKKHLTSFMIVLNGMTLQTL
jgi:hypothetical protein